MVADCDLGKKHMPVKRLPAAHNLKPRCTEESGHPSVFRQPSLVASAQDSTRPRSWSEGRAEPPTALSPELTVSHACQETSHSPHTSADAHCPVLGFWGQVCRKNGITVAGSDTLGSTPVPELSAALRPHGLHGPEMQSRLSESRKRV